MERESLRHGLSVTFLNSSERSSLLELTACSDSTERVGTTSLWSWSSGECGPVLGTSSETLLVFEIST